MRMMLGLCAVALMHAPAALAENIKGFEQQTRGKQTYTRYPGDKGYDFGTTQRELNGPEQPYVERCVWTAEAQFLGGFKQTCYRYTPETTPQ